MSHESLLSKGENRCLYDKYSNSFNTENNSKEMVVQRGRFVCSLKHVCVLNWWSHVTASFHHFIQTDSPQARTTNLFKGHLTRVFFLPRETLAGTARRSIQNDTHESITMSVAGKYVCSRKKKMWRRNVKLMYRRLYQPANTGRDLLRRGGILKNSTM